MESAGPRLCNVTPGIMNVPSLTRLETCNSNLEFDLSLISLGGLPNLTSLTCKGCPMVTGALLSLRPIMNSLGSLHLAHCPGVTGSLDDLGDFSMLVTLLLGYCPGLSGSVGDIGPGDFPALRAFSVFGSSGIVGSTFLSNDSQGAWEHFLAQPGRNFELRFDSGFGNDLVFDTLEAAAETEIQMEPHSAFISRHTGGVYYKRNNLPFMGDRNPVSGNVYTKQWRELSHRAKSLRAFEFDKAVHSDERPDITYDFPICPYMYVAFHD
mmetsp:Transcript_7811/g.21744  ORF Transcript_7811/g.21744 Transcript_7811/m.21744 type:complete len:267 (+) Transcript_7811:272-1072(+)